MQCLFLVFLKLLAYLFYGFVCVFSFLICNDRGLHENYYFERGCNSSW